MAMSNTREALRRQGPMIWIVGWIIALTLAYPPIRQAWDSHMLPRPWVNPVVQVAANPDGKPVITYAAQPVAEVSGTWTAWLEVQGRRCCTAKGEGSYIPNRPAREWEWEDWLGRDWPVPTRPFAACVAYDLRTASGARAQFGPFCSNVFDPRGQE